MPLGMYSFFVASPVLWNSVLFDIYLITTSCSHFQTKTNYCLHFVDHCFVVCMLSYYIYIYMVTVVTVETVADLGFCIGGFY